VPDDPSRSDKFARTQYVRSSLTAGPDASRDAPVAPPEASTVDERPGVSARSLLLGLAVGVPISAGLLYIATRNVGWELVRASLREAHWLPLLAAVAAFAGVYAIQSARWRWIARREAPLSELVYLRLVVAGIGANNVLPGRPGDLLRAHWLHRRSGVRGSRALGTVIVDRSCDVFVLLAMLVATYPFTPHRPWIEHLLVASLAVTGVIAAGLVATRVYVGHRARDGRTLPLRVRMSWPGRQLSGFIRATAAIVRGSDMAVALGLSVAAWLTWAAAAWLVADALGFHLNLWQTVFVTGLVNLGTAVPSSPGFVGTYQWLCVSALGLFGVGASEAFAYSLLLQAAWFVPTTVVGVPLAVRLSMETRRA
jgi:glycosyltransferase 2 family protein